MSRKPNPYRDELNLARSQYRRLQTMIASLNRMAEEWGDWHAGLECDFNLLVEAVEPQLKVMDEQIKEWKDGIGDPKD
ncbi:hypothetical protein [Cedecea sp. P7760]|uniref:hypothetical protein n=1 Tax=Cedecea sp. P7760 TaxID=2726983 RepID=UPI0015A09131|nr:hypothetical protein [Cedecea sp. P7760]NWC63996.1 hypothetical protein [Cedecea sp. P7760]